MSSISAPYYEFKYLVAPQSVPWVRSYLASHLAEDAFATGCVDSVYYDTLDGRSRAEAANGDGIKMKFRVRGYGNGWVTAQCKERRFGAVLKQKADATHIVGIPPYWPFDLLPQSAQRMGPLTPVLRVTYTRHRFRAGSARVTLDEGISVTGVGRSIRGRSTLAFAVVEIKTVDPHPSYRFLRDLGLRLSSGSKFGEGLRKLDDRGRGVAT